MEREKNRVIEVNNLIEKNRKFDIKSLLSKSFGCIFYFTGAYKNVGDSNILVERGSDEVDYHLYTNMETNELVKVPVEFSDAFEKSNHVVLEIVKPLENRETDDIHKKRREYKRECAKFINSFASNR